MRPTVLNFVIGLALMIPVAAVAADITDIAGTWSGNWTPKGGIIDAATVEIRVEGGKVMGKFRTPVAMDFTRATFDPKTGNVSLEAKDPKSGHLYKLDGKLSGSDIKGTMTVGTTPGEVLLIKWTYIPR